MTRFHSSAGIAIGPILFILAILALIAAVMSVDSGGMGSAITADSITPQLYTQANLIRSKMHECETIRGSWPTSDASGTAIEDVDCPNDPSGQENMWTGARPTPLAPPPRNFDGWVYYDHSGTGGGRCISIAPTASAASSGAVKQGIAKAFGKFTTMEADYDPNGSAQNLVIWITRPTGSAHADCTAG